jgi:hypothetical protein
MVRWPNYAELPGIAPREFNLSKSHASFAHNPYGLDCIINVF